MLGGTRYHPILEMGNMNTKLATLVAIAAFATLSSGAEAKGCLEGAAVGGVAGHVAGHHGVLGAAAGCAIGHHVAKKKEKEAKRQAELARHEPTPDTPLQQREMRKN
jgi:hypothetical protein